MPQPRKTAAARKAAAAQTEKNDQPKSLEWRGLTFTMPAALPGTVALDYADVEEGLQAIAPIRNLIRSVIGPEQYGQVYDKIRDDGVTFDEIVDVLGGLVDAVFDAYGTDTGESEASATS